MKEITFDPQNQLLKGVRLLANAVKVTLGPKGRNVLIQDNGRPPVVTKDGVTVAKNINVKDPVPNMAIQLLKQAASRTAQEAGDGTTTSTILAASLYEECLKQINNGEKASDLKKQLDYYLPLILDELESNGLPLTEDNLVSIATISSNNDEHLGKLIADAFKYVGKEGVIVVQDSLTDETYIKATEGVSFDRGYLSSYFITDPSRQLVEYENPLIFYYDKKLRSTQQIMPLVEAAHRAKRPLVVIADEIEGQALSILIANKVQASVPIVAVKAPAFGQRRTEILKDLSILTGGELISDDKGQRPETTTLLQLGSCDKIIISQNDTIMVGPHGNKELIDNRVEELKFLLESATDTYTKDKLLERIAKLSAKTATLYVGASTETEITEKKHRIDDALCAVRAAYKKGFLPGGGSALYRVTQYLILPAFIESALIEPLKVLIHNSSGSIDLVASALSKNKDYNYGYNGNTNNVEDLIEAGIIDPTLVVLEALKNAFSVASMLILTSVVVNNDTTDFTPDIQSTHD